MGVRLWELGARRLAYALGLREAAMPFMEDAHAVLGHHVQLGVLDGAEVLFVERLSAPGAVINLTRIAGRLPLHVSSSGLVLLAFGERELQEQVLSRPLARYTAHTLSSPAALRAALAEVRRQEFACLPGHVHEDALGIAVPGSATAPATAWSRRWRPSSRWAPRGRRSPACWLARGPRASPGRWRMRPAEGSSDPPVRSLNENPLADGLRRGA